MSDALENLSLQDLLKYAKHFEKVNELLIQENRKFNEVNVEVIHINKQFALKCAEYEDQINSLLNFIEEMLLSHPNAEAMAKKWNTTMANSGPKFIPDPDLDTPNDMKKKGK